MVALHALLGRHFDKVILITMIIIITTIVTATSFLFFRQRCCRDQEVYAPSLEFGIWLAGGDWEPKMVQQHLKLLEYNMTFFSFF